MTEPRWSVRIEQHCSRARIGQEPEVVRDEQQRRTVWRMHHFEMELSGVKLSLFVGDGGGGALGGSNDFARGSAEGPRAVK